jgi:predicted sulfurtransferase
MRASTALLQARQRVCKAILARYAKTLALQPCSTKAATDAMPFYRMRVRLKKEIVTLGVPGLNPA